MDCIYSEPTLVSSLRVCNVMTFTFISAIESNYNYSDLPNNRAAKLFFGKKNTYTNLLGPTRLLISENFPSKPDFHLHKCEKILPTQPY